MKKTIYYKVVGIVFLTILFSHVHMPKTNVTKLLSTHTYMDGSIVSKQD